MIILTKCQGHQEKLSPIVGATCKNPGTEKRVRELGDAVCCLF
jgi:hypothetical protein